MAGFMSGVAGGATVAIIIKAVDQYSGELNKAQKSVKSFTTTVTLWGAAAVAAGAAVLDLSVKAGIATGKMNAFNNMMGKKASLALEELTKATKGTVSQIDLVTAANQAMLLGIDEKMLPKMFEGAYSAAAATGRPISDAIADITLGIGRQSRMILDNLGIIVKVDEANKAYADTLGKTVEQLTDAERNAAFLSATMTALEENERKIGEVTETTNVKLERLKASWENLSIEMGEVFMPLTNKVIDAMTSIFTGEILEEQKKFSVLLATRMQIVGDAIRNIFVILFEEIKNIFKGGWNSIVKDAEIAVNRLISIMNAIPGINIDSVNFSGGMFKLTDMGAFKTQLTRESYAKASEIYRNYERQLNNIPGVPNNTGNSTPSSEDLRLSKLTSSAGNLFRYISQTGDVFNPDFFNRSEFQSDFAFQQAKRGGGIVVNIELLQGLDSGEISRTLAEELNAKLSL